MKIRNGFVSNSSSSSFVAIVPKEEYDKLELTPAERALAEVLGMDKTTIFDHECLVYHNMYGNYGYEDWLDRSKVDRRAQEIAVERGEKLEFNRDDIWEYEDSLTSKLCKIAVFTHSEDF